MTIFNLRRWWRSSVPAQVSGSLSIAHAVCELVYAVGESPTTSAEFVYRRDGVVGLAFKGTEMEAEAVVAGLRVVLGTLKQGGDDAAA